MPFNVYSIYRRTQPWLRRRRWQQFFSCFQLSPAVRIVDVGGHVEEWMTAIEGPLSLTLVNLSPWPAELAVPPGYLFRQGDARALPFSDRTFDIGYSNSVIEHMGSWEDQVKFAREISRVADGLFVQTPNRWFPVEPHLLGFFTHWLPLHWHRRLAPWLSVRGWLRRGDDVALEQLFAEVRLLGVREMQALFPDCEIVRERVFGLTKSLIAVRRHLAPPDGAGE